MRFALLALLCCLAIVPAAHGFVIEGDRWPGPTISVWNGTGYKAPVLDAMRSWNAAGAKVRFVPAQSSATADVVVRIGVISEQGLAVVGYEPGSNGHPLAGASAASSRRRWQPTSSGMCSGSATRRAVAQ